jgi:hypothetical protein
MRESKLGSAKTQAASSVLSLSRISEMRSAPGRLSGETVTEPTTLRAKRASKY